MRKGTHFSEETLAKLRAARKGRRYSAETRAKLSLALIGNKRMLGKHLSAEHKEKLIVAFTGRKFSPETLAKMSASAKGRKLSPETRAKLSAVKKGRPKTEEHRAKIGASNKGRISYWKGKKLPDEMKAKISVSAFRRVSTGTFGSWHNGYRHFSEMFVADWMNNQNWEYKYEEKGYQVDGNHKYWPDFHVYSEDRLIKIVEVKSYKYSEPKGKTKMFMDQYPDLPFEIWDKPKLQQVGILP